jgi:hypothetical protein
MDASSVCYDPSRPSWLPTWLDDFQESACKINMLACGNTTCGNPNAGAEQAAAGSTVIAPTGSGTSTSGGSLAVTNPSPTNCAAVGLVWDAGSQQCVSANPLTGYLPWLIAAGALGLVVLVAKK